MANDVMRKKLEADKARLQKKLDMLDAKALPLRQQVGLYDRMLAELDAFEKQAPGREVVDLDPGEDRALVAQPAGEPPAEIPSFRKKQPSN
jgi:hypothetical protein